MAIYKRPCIHCGMYIESDLRCCIFCGNLNPFGYYCPTCHGRIQKGQVICGNCKREIYVSCPSCGQQTFVQDTCEKCGNSLMIRCENERCGQLQFFQNIKCTCCGKSMKDIKKIGIFKKK